MRKLLLIIVLAIGLIEPNYAQDSLHVLFLGNSYTYYNSMPAMVGSMATSTGDVFSYSANTPGGYTFQQHSADATSLNLIAQGNWDYVVLQEQSQLPSFPDNQVEQDVFPFARKLDSLITAANHCTETVFYNTWGRKNGDAANCQFFPPLCTYQGMDSLLQLRYNMMADSNDAIVSPVAQLWRYLRTNNPAIELYNPDESHPSEAGSYAAACAFYTVMYRKDPTAITYNANLSANDAAAIRTAAKLIVFDHLEDWNVGKYDNVANFYYNSICLFATFFNQNMYVDSVSWNFGDGSPVSTEFIPVHMFVEEGFYPVTLTTYRCGTMDTTTLYAQIWECGSVNEKLSQKVKTYPNPFIDKIAITSELTSKPGVWQLFNAQGQLVQSGNLNNQMLIDNLGNLPKGPYLLRLTVGDKMVVKRVVKE